MASYQNAIHGLGLKVELLLYFDISKSFIRRFSIWKQRRTIMMILTSIKKMGVLIVMIIIIIEKTTFGQYNSRNMNYEIK